MRNFFNSQRCLGPLYDNMNDWNSSRDFEGTVMDNFFNNLHYSNWLIGVKNMASLQNACKPPNNRGNVTDAGNNTLPHGNTPEQVVTPTHLRKEGYKAIKKIGQGTFSEVVKTLSLKDLKFYACKTLKQTINSLEQAKNLREVQVMRRLSPHANIIQLHDLIFNKDTGTVSLICDLMEMNIHEFIQERETPLPDHMVQNYMYQLCKALKHMHSYGIFHRDVKPENILIKQNSLKLGDFGLCLSVSSRPPHTEYISTRWYRAPECLLTSGYYDFKMDLWSAGCVFFEIMSLKPLFPGTSELDQVDKIHNVLGTPDQSILQKFKRSTALDFNFTPRKGTGISRLIPSCPAPALSLLYQMLAYDPNERISAGTALQHTCFREIRFVGMTTTVEGLLSWGLVRLAEQNPESPRRLYGPASSDHIWRPRHTTLMSPRDELHCTAFKTFYLPPLDQRPRDY